MLYAGYCIGGPWHGQAQIAWYSHIEVVTARSSPTGDYEELFTVDRVIYRHLRNEYGDWWIVP